jgi:hypothetical protein
MKVGRRPQVVDIMEQVVAEKSGFASDINEKKHDAWRHHTAPDLSFPGRRDLLLRP